MSPLITLSPFFKNIWDTCHGRGEPKWFWLLGSALSFDKLDSINDNFPIPHVGWNDVVWEENSKLKLNSTSCFYFVHSYGLIEKPTDAQLECYTEYGQKIIAGIRKNNISGFQFHPEKSQDEGLSLLENWVIQND